MAKIEISGEFSEHDGDVYFGSIHVLYPDGEANDEAPDELIEPARAWKAEQESVVEVIVKVKFSRNMFGGVSANGIPVITRAGLPTEADGLSSYPELATAARNWARKNP